MTQGERQEDFEELLNEYPDGFHFEETSQADDVVELYFKNSFVDMFSTKGIDPGRLDNVIQDFLDKKGPRVS